MGDGWKTGDWDEVRSELEELSGKVLGIGKLQEVFTEKVRISLCLSVCMSVRI